MAQQVNPLATGLFGWRRICCAVVLFAENTKIEL
jgi:hypothetical protein